MAQKSSVVKAQVQVADMDRQVYVDHALTMAKHPSETDERVMVRLLAFVLHAPGNDDGGKMDFGKGLSDTEEPDLWRRNLTGEIEHWIDVGQPDDRRLVRASGRARRVTVVGYHAGFAQWWDGIAGKLNRLSNLDVWQLEAASIRQLTELAQKSMHFQVTVQDGLVWVANDERSVELAPKQVFPAP